jgi:hypothetical protein
MIEKTFLEPPLSSPSPSLRQKRGDVAAARSVALEEKRERARNYISASLQVSTSSVVLFEGIDVWDMNRGRYSGEAEVEGSQYKFTSQSYASGGKVLTHFTIEKK